MTKSVGILLTALLTAARAAEKLDPPDGGGIAPADREASVAANSPVEGPRKGWLVIAGGGELGQEVLGRFIALAGGPAAPIVVIPTAGKGETYGNDAKGMQVLRRAGAANLLILHTRSRQQADSETFVEPLRKARGVWLSGGRQWRLADAYLDTLVEKELHALLDRGGVIGGTSAGASIQASYLVRGAPEGNHVMMAPGHQRGFDFLHHAAIDQHLLARHRQDDLLAVIRAHPSLLGIGLDEGTAIVVQGSHFEVIGKSQVAIYGADASANGGKPYVMLSPGGTFNFKTRRPN